MNKSIHMLVESIASCMNESGRDYRNVVRSYDGYDITGAMKWGKPVKRREHKAEANYIDRFLDKYQTAEDVSEFDVGWDGKSELTPVEKKLVISKLKNRINQAVDYLTRLRNYHSQNIKLMRDDSLYTDEEVETICNDITKRITAILNEMQ